MGVFRLWPGLRRGSLVAILAGALGVTAFSEAAAAPAGVQPTRVWMRGVVIYPFDDAPTHIDRLSGVIKPAQAGRPVNMDEVASYAIDVGEAEVRVPAESLAALLNRYLLPTARTDLKRVDIRFENDAIRLRGTLKKAGVPIGFSATAVAAPTPSGEMRLDVVKMKAAGFIHKSLMDALGLNLATFAQPERPGVFRIEKNTIYVPMSSIFPPPKFQGRLKSVKVTPQGIRAVMGGAASPGPPPPQSSPAYLMFRGGRVQFGKLTMSDVDMTLLPRKKTATLGFSASGYYRQLVAGYSMSTPDRGLVSYVADYRDLGRGPRRP
jgi:hypothetical protein